MEDPGPKNSCTCAGLARRDGISGGGRGGLRDHGAEGDAQGQQAEADEGAPDLLTSIVRFLASIA